MNIRLTPLMLAIAASGMISHSAVSQDSSAGFFNRVAAFPAPMNMTKTDDKAQETSPEIIDATADEQTLVYTDSPLGAIGFVDISDLADPKPKGNLALDGEPTAVSVLGSTAFAGVNTSESFVKPSGYLMSIDVNTQSEIARCDLGGQPDSVAVDEQGRFVAVAIENERDEDLNDGEIPQLPAGYLQIVPLSDGQMNCDASISVDLTGLAEIGGSDPEPEFVDINALGEIVVTLQENNHLVVVSQTGEILSDFSAGSVDLRGIDTREEGALVFDQSQEARLREPDSVNWIDNDHFATANEGDYNGGSRGWTIFNKDGSVVYEDGTRFEQEIIRLGHYPEERSGNKGVEPESIEVTTINEQTYILVGAERSSVVGVYRVDPSSEASLANPVLQQILPSGIGPEGILGLPSRNALVTANEVDLVEDGGPRAHVMMYSLENTDKPNYPSIKSTDSDLIGWTALSGMVADTENEHLLYAVNDSFLSLQPRIFSIDTSSHPAIITSAIDVTRGGHPAQKLDLEGITTDGEGGFWLASEGRTDQLRPHALLHVDSMGEIQDEIAFPAELLAHAKRFAAEGITLVDSTLWVAIQREWQDDPAGKVKLLAYNIDEQTWSGVHYPLDKTEKGWVGLSEITAYEGDLYVLERDNQIGSDAQIKRLYKVAMDSMQPKSLGEELVTVEKTLVRDLLADLQAPNGYVQDKVEGFAISNAGEGFVITDNDGVDDHSGETHFWSIGQVK